MKKIKYLFLVILLLNTSSVSGNTDTFEDWLKSFKRLALQKNISEDTFNKTMSNVKFLPDVIKYDRYQPEFYDHKIQVDIYHI